MGKRKLTTEQKIASYKKKRRIKIGIKILIATLIVAALIPATYFGYYYLVFTVFPGNSDSSYKINGLGYCRPLRMIYEVDSDSQYVLAYYYDDCWHVVEDSEKIIQNRNNFIIYNKDNERHEGSHLQLILIKDNYLFNSIPLYENMLMDNRCFRDCTKKMTMEEFKNYVVERGYTSVYIQ